MGSCFRGCGALLHFLPRLAATDGRDVGLGHVVLSGDGRLCHFLVSVQPADLPDIVMGKPRTVHLREAACLVAVPVVVLRGASDEVSLVAAQLVVALVPDVDALRDRAVVDHVGEPVSVLTVLPLGVLVGPDVAVAYSLSTLVLPALVRATLVHVRPVHVLPLLLLAGHQFLRCMETLEP